MKRCVRRSRRLAAVIACALLCAPAGAQAVEALPDLVADAPIDKGLQVIDGRLLLRFDGFIRNTGPGAAELRGGSPTDGVLTNVRQRIYNDDLSFSRDVPSPAIIRYENHADHSHFHLQSAARYSLWTEDRVFEVIGSEKAGFCLTDSNHSEPAKGPPTPQYAPDFCSAGNPAPLADVIMGISSGWRDDYPSFLAFQWLDVSSLRPGNYRLGADVDPDNFVIEANESNPVAFQDQVSVVPGYVARAQDLGQVNPFVPVQIRLDADNHVRTGGLLGVASFAVTKQPGCGRLSGDPPLVVYEPDSSCQGTISFDFTARDSASAFPKEPPSATVSLRLGTRDALAKPRARRRGRRLRVRMRSLYAGTLRATALRRGKRLGSCSRLAAANQPVACTIRLKRGQRLLGARVRTSLRIGGAVVDKRRDRLG